TLCGFAALALSLVLSPSTVMLRGQSNTMPAAPVALTAQEDHARVLQVLHIAAIPAGPRSGCPETYDEATANPYPKLPDPLTMANGKKVTSAAMWTQRRAEILEDFE